MRKISGIEIFLSMLIPTFAFLSALFFIFCVNMLFLNFFEFGFNFKFLTSFVFIFYCFELLNFKIFLKLFPLHEGDIKTNSFQEKIYHIYILQYLIFIYPLTFNKSIPTPLRKTLTVFLGAKIGNNSYSSGIIFDPTFVTIGSNSILGINSLVIPHSIEGEKLSHEKIIISNNVTVGANAVIHSGCIINQGAIIASGAVLPKGTIVGQNEIWGGVPAKKLSLTRQNASFTNNKTLVCGASEESLLR